MIYSRWPHEKGFEAWVTDSQVCLAKSDSMLGKFKYVKTLFDYSPDENGENLVIHNPTVIKWHDRFYLYHMVNTGSGDWWGHRNNQRVGVAYASDPEGEWTRVEEPVIDISPEGIDSLMTSNPTALVTKDDKILMVYKAVSKYGEMPKGGKVICGAAVADSPLGPFKKFDKPIMENPEHPWAVEDPYIWSENGKYYALVKDFQGYFTKTQKGAVALFESENGADWNISENYLAFEKKLYLENGIKEVRNLERPQLYIEDGKPKCLLCACMEYDNAPTTFNIRIPLK